LLVLRRPLLRPLAAVTSCALPVTPLWIFTTSLMASVSISTTVNFTVLPAGAWMPHSQLEKAGYRVTQVAGFAGVVPSVGTATLPTGEAEANQPLWLVADQEELQAAAGQLGVPLRQFRPLRHSHPPTRSNRVRPATFQVRVKTSVAARRRKQAG
jgi:hypothetical protein